MGETKIQKEETRKGKLKRYEELEVVDTDFQEAAAEQIHGLLCTSMNLDPTATFFNFLKI